MPIRQVQLVKGAKAKARQFGVPVGLLQNDDTYALRVGKDGTAFLDSRDYRLLKLHGLIEDSVQLASPAADQPEAEKAADSSRTKTKKRGPSGSTTKTPPGGAGHTPGEGWGNDRIQAETATEQGLFPSKKGA